MTACPVFLVGEGPSDVGDLAKDPPFRGKGEGFLQPILRRMAESRITLEIRDGASIHTFAKKAVTEPRDVYGRKARQALALAGFSGARALVVAVDVDKESGAKRSKTEARRASREKREAIESGFAAARADDTDLEAVVTVVALPCRMLESWALADPAAIGRAMSSRAPSLPAGSPEDYWGDEQDPKRNHPKRVLERALGRPATADDFANIAGEADLAVLEARCPESFAPFARAVRDALDGCVGPEERASERRSKRRPRR